MINKGKLAIIGDLNNVYAFKAIGVETHEANDAVSAKKQLNSLVKSGDYAIIFIAEDLAEELSNELEELKNLTFPCVLPLPVSGESSGYGMKSIRKDVEKAIGADILSDD